MTEQEKSTATAGEETSTIMNTNTTPGKKQKRLSNLEKELNERNSQIKALESKQVELKSLIQSIEAELKEKKVYVKQLEDLLNTNDQRVKDLERTLADKQESMELMMKEYSKASLETQNIKKKDSAEMARFEKLARDLMLLESYNATLKNTLVQREAELDEIKNSVIYNTVKRIARFVDLNAPPNSSRRKLIGTLQNRLAHKSRARTIPVEKMKEVSRPAPRSVAKIESQSPANDPSKVIAMSSIIRELKRLESINIDALEGQIIMPKLDLSIRDESIEHFIDYGSHNVTRLKAYPLVSIIIATYSNLEDLKKNINALETRTAYPNFEVIVVTNNKDPSSEMRKYLSTLSRHSVYIYEPEYSFAGINNFGATKAKGELLLFLNDDTEAVEPQWLEPLVKLMENPSTGAAGGMMIYPDGTLQEAGGIVWGDQNIWNYGKFLHTSDDPDVNFVREVDYCSGGFLMVRKSIFDEVGGFDMMYHPAYCEDVDLCFAIRDKGYSVQYQPKSVIVHKEGGTQGTDTSRGIKAYQVVNQKKFFEKWSHKLKGRLPSSKENVFAERSRRSGKRILYIDHYVPMPDQDSGSLRTFYTLGILSYLGHDVTFWPENLAKFEPYVTELQQKGIEVILGPNNFDEFLAKRGQFFDIAILTRPHIAINFVDKIINLAPRCKIMYDTTDIHFLRLYRQAVLENNPTIAKDARHIKAVELKLARASVATFVVTKKEAVILKDQDATINPVVLPNIHIPISTIVGFNERKNIYFIGGFQHTPNVDAAMFLVKEIFPLIKREINDLKLFIVGSKPPDSVKMLAGKDIEVTDYVPDITPYLNNCKVMVAPLRYGAGLKGKITEATSYGLPVVTTDIGAEGTGLIDEQSILIGNTAEEFAKKVIRLYTDSDLWTRISQGGYDEALKRYAPRNISDMLQELLNSLDNESRSLKVTTN